jgi:hypothetical protein
MTTAAPAKNLKVLLSYLGEVLERHCNPGYRDDPEIITHLLNQLFLRNDGSKPSHAESIIQFATECGLAIPDITMKQFSAIAAQHAR